MRTIENKQKEEIEYIRERVLRKFPLLGVAMASLQTVAEDAVGTAGTDGKTVYYSPKFMEGLSDDEKTFLYAHEVMHIAFNHIMRSKGRNPRLWNIATDSVINQILKSEDLPLIEGGVDMAEAVNRSAEEMYEKLLKEQEDKKQQSQQNCEQRQEEQQQESGQKQDNKPQSGQEQRESSSQSSSEQDKQQEGQEQQREPQDQNGGKNSENQDGEEENSQVGHDNHQIWKKALEEAEREQQRQEKKAQQKQSHPHKNETKSQSILDKLKDLFSRKEQPEEKLNKEETQKSFGESGEGQRAKGDESVYERNFSSENRREKQRQAEQIRKTLERQKNETMKAKVEASGHSFGPLGDAKAVLDWKKMLKKSIEEDEDRWSYRRSGADNDYMARVEELEDENKSETEVMLDVSGSVDEELLKEFLRQLKPILKNSKLKVGCFDHRLSGFQEIKKNKDIDDFHIVGGGGTNIDLAVRAFSKKKEINKIVFTDGYSNDMPRQDLKNMNVIWLIYDNDDFHPVCGRVIYVDKQQMRQNYMQIGRGSRGGR